METNASNQNSNNPGADAGSTGETFTAVPPYKPTPPPQRYRSVVGPIILVVVGTVFLLSNLRLIQSNIWTLAWRLWPVWLIAVGFDILVGRRYRWGSFLVAGTTLAILGGAAYYMETTSSFLQAGLGPYEPISQQVTGAKDAYVTVEAGVGRFNLQGGAPEGTLVDGQARTLNGFRIVKDFRMMGESAHLILKEDGSNFAPNFNISGSGPNWDLNLAENLPMNLYVKTGVGESRIDLSTLKLREFELETGVGQTTLRLPGEGVMSGTISTGVGETTIYIPVGVAARVTVHTGIGGANMNGDFRKSGDTYQTPDYATATENKLDLMVSGGIGAISVIQR